MYSMSGGYLLSKVNRYFIKAQLSNNSNKATPRTKQKTKKY